MPVDLLPHPLPDGGPDEIVGGFENALAAHIHLV